MIALARRLGVVGPLSARRTFWSVLVFALLALTLLPYGFLARHVFLLVYLGVPLALLAGLAGYLPRRRWSDAAWLALPVLAANGIEQEVGSPALVCLALPWFALTRRPRFSILLGGSVLALLLAGIQLKTRFAGSRLTWQDVQFFFAQFRDNLGVAASQPTILLYVLAALVAIGVVLAGGWWWDGRGGPVRSQRSPAWASAALSIALVLWSGLQLQAEAQRARRIGVWQVAQIEGWSALPISRFLATAALKPEWTPAAVDTAPYRERAARLAAAASAAPLPDVLLFLQESQMNPAAFAGCPPALCRLPLFDGGPGTQASGPLRVHVFGAGTWLSEFTVATGVPHTAFGEAGGFAPFSVAPGTRRSFVRSLRAAGYHTVAVYPVRGGMMNARQAYAGYGFDRFYDSTDLGLTGAFSTSDEVMHQAALRVLEDERKQGKPVLLFVITIFNHGEHGQKMDRVPAALREQVRAHVAQAAEADNLADYLWRTQEFQRVMGQTRHSVLQGPRPAVLAWYGDHQPPFGGATALRDRVQSLAPAVPARFLTWYEISSNLPGATAPGQEPLDIAFLSGRIAQAAGVPLDDWLAANVMAREQCGGLIEECRDGKARDAYLSYLWHDLKAFVLP